MALPWYAHNIAKYERKTAHLSMLQHGAYRLLLDHYYRTAAPLPAKLEQVHRICRAVAEEEQQAVSAVLEEFFVLEADGWHNQTADEELARMAKSYWRRLRLIQPFGDRPDPITWAALRAQVFERDDFTCRYCGKRGGDLECDHIVPVVQNGASVPGNLVTACLSCNREKGGRTPEQWLQ